MTLNQATRAVYGVARPDDRTRTRTDGPGDVLRARSATSRVETPFNGGELFPVSCDVDGLQGLDPSFRGVRRDRVHARRVVGSLLLASGKRPSSLVCGIGTPGFDQANALFHLRQRAHEGSLPPGFNFTEYSADDGCDIEDESQWQKANPALREGFMDVDALRLAVKLSPESHVAYLPARAVRRWCRVVARPGTRGRYGKVLAEPWPMVAGRRADVGRCRRWVETRLDRDKHGANVDPMAGCTSPRRYGFHATTDGSTSPTRCTTSAGSRAIYDVRNVSYDPKMFELAAQQLADEGLPMVDSSAIGRADDSRGWRRLSAIRRGEISHDGDGACSAAQVLAALARFNTSGFTLGERECRDRIDAAVAMVLALAEARQTGRPRKSSRLGHGEREPTVTNPGYEEAQRRFESAIRHRKRTARRVVLAAGCARMNETLMDFYRRAEHGVISTRKSAMSQIVVPLLLPPS